MKKLSLEEIKGRKKDLQPYRYMGSLLKVRVPVEDVLAMLTRLEKLEKKEAKRKAKKAAAAISEDDALYGPLREGDRVALTRTLETHLWPYVIEGAQGTVKRIDTGGSYNVRVVLDKSENHPLSFQRSELRKIDCGK